ncbi:MAG: hypothetical protein ABEI77_06170 [Halorientalis sp.]
MARNHTLLAVGIVLFVVAAPATAMGATTAGTQAAANQTQTNGSLPPGVHENGSVNTTTLYRAHKQVLLDEGYQTSENLTIWVNGSTFMTVATDTAASPDNANVSMTKNLTVVGLDYDIASWSNESQTTVRVVKDNNTTYKIVQRGPPAYASENESNGNYGPHHGNDRGMGPHRGDDGEGYHHGDHMNVGMMGMHHGMGMYDTRERVPGYAVAYLDEVAGNFTIANETTMDNHTVYTLTAPVEVDEDAKGNYTGNVSLSVDERGVVHSANVSVSSDEYDAVTYYTFSLDELGVDSVQEPGWIEDVPANATTYGPPEDMPGDHHRGDGSEYGR